MRVRRMMVDRCLLLSLLMRIVSSLVIANLRGKRSLGLGKGCLQDSWATVRFRDMVSPLMWRRLP